MKRFISISLLLFAFSLIAQAQDYSLKFSRVISLSNSEMTVPVDKVWKVTAVTGREFFQSACIDVSDGTTDEIGKLLTGVYDNASFLNNSIKVSYSISKLIINGVTVPFRISFPNSALPIYYSSTSCTGGSNTFTNLGTDYVNMASDPNALPMWLAAGTTLKTGGPNTIASIIEFSLVQ